MSLRIRLSTAQRLLAKCLSVAAVGAFGLTAFSGAAQAHPGSGAHNASGTVYGGWVDVGGLSPDYGARDPLSNRAFRRFSGCKVGARRMLGSIVKGTVKHVVHRRLDSACAVALTECRASLESLRGSGKRFIRTAKCKVLRRQTEIAASTVHRCVAKAYTRRGNPLSHTRSVQLRVNERQACVAALDGCDRRLAAKRVNDGYNYRRAVCEVVRSREMAAYPRGARDDFRRIDYRN